MGHHCGDGPLDWFHLTYVRLPRLRHASNGGTSPDAEVMHLTLSNYFRVGRNAKWRKIHPDTTLAMMRSNNVLFQIRGMGAVGEAAGQRSASQIRTGKLRVPSQGATRKSSPTALT